MNSELIERLKAFSDRLDLTWDEPIWEAIVALEKADLDLIAAEKALTDSEARNHFLETEIMYCAERLAKLAEKKETRT
jgi:hypothetical protein